jgi:ABC-type phosphate transport system substrate-binding protein
MSSSLPKFGLFVALLVSGSFHALAFEGAVVIANPGVAADSLSTDKIEDIYTGGTKYWDDGQAIIIIVLPDKTDAALQQASGMDANHFKTFWQRMVFSGHGRQPSKADDAAALVALVASTKGAIALVPTNAVLKGVKIIEVKQITDHP